MLVIAFRRADVDRLEPALDARGSEGSAATPALSHSTEEHVHADALAVRSPG